MPGPHRYRRALSKIFRSAAGSVSKLERARSFAPR